ncbi:MAG TPA: hypothetical protein VGE30_01810 [Candidatus Saccharimonadales bacterium]
MRFSSRSRAFQNTKTRFISLTTAAVVAVASLSGAAPLFLSQKALAAAPEIGTFTVSGDTSAGENQDGWMFNRDASTTTPYEFSTAAHSNGDGSIYVNPIGATPADKFIAEHFMSGTLMSDVSTISVDYKFGAGVATSKADQFYMNVYANFAASDPLKFYDCRYNIVASTGSTTDFSTLTFDANEAVSGSSSVTQRNTSPAACPTTPSAMGAGATIRAFAISVGDTSANDVGVHGYLDNARVVTTAGTSAFDFEPEVVAQIGFTNYYSLQDAVNAATPGATIDLWQDITVSGATITLGKAVTIDGHGNTLTTTGTHSVFTITGSDVTIKNLHVVKTDNVSAQNIIGIQGDNVAILNNTFSGEFVLPTTGATSRALVTSNGAENLVIANNSFTNLRQPAYLNNGSAGLISDNYVTGTRGWVVEKNSDFTFLGNVWGYNSDDTKQLDIAVIAGSSPATTSNNYTCELAAIALVNDGARIEDQYPAANPCADTTPTVELPSNALNPVNFTVPAGTTSELQLTADTSNPSATTAVVPVDVYVDSSDASVYVPAGTTITGPAGTWDGKVTLPTVVPSSSLTTYVTNPVGIEVGAGDTPLTFDNAVRISLTDQGNRLAGFVRNGVFTPITDVCADDTQLVGNSLPAGEDCYMTVGNDLVIWTKHFTVFVAYTAVVSKPAPTNTTTSTSSNNGNSTAVAAATRNTASVADTAASVLGIGSGTDSAKTTKKAASAQNKDAKEDSSAFLGLGWWWLLILAVVAAVLGYLYMVRRADRA